MAAAGNGGMGRASLRVALLLSVALLAGTQAPRAATPADIADLRAGYDAWPLEERYRLQRDLGFTGDHSGGIDGEIGPRSQEAVRSFQRRRNEEPTGVLTPTQRRALAAEAAGRRSALGWREAEDGRSGLQFGLPAGRVGAGQPTARGIRHTAADGAAVIETERRATATDDMNGVVTALLAEVPGRTATSRTVRADGFTLAGTQAGLRFAVRGVVAGAGDLRLFVVQWDPRRLPDFEPAAHMAVQSAALRGTPQPGAGDGAVALPVGAGPKRPVDYGVGVVVSADGAVLTARALIDGCSGIEILGLGPVDVVAEDRSTGLALLRRWGARGLMAVALGGGADEREALDVALYADAVPGDGPPAVTRGEVQRVFEDRLVLGRAFTGTMVGAPVVGSGGRLAGLVLHRAAPVRIAAAPPAPAPRPTPPAATPLARPPATPAPATGAAPRPPAAPPGAPPQAAAARPPQSAAAPGVAAGAPRAPQTGAPQSGAAVGTPQGPRAGAAGPAAQPAAPAPAAVIEREPPVTIAAAPQLMARWLAVHGVAPIAGGAPVTAATVRIMCVR
jgi:hypothetical protein